MVAADAQAEFGFWRGLLWPVRRHELPKVLSMFLMFMCITFNYTLLRNTKDALVVTAAGAEIIPFLKVWCVLPAAVIYMALYSKASNVLSKQSLFRWCILPFMMYFLAFGLYIYPNRQSLHPHSSADYLQKYLPAGLVSIYRYWSFAVFYVLSELWGTVVLSVLFWGLANDVTPVTEAKRIYALLGVGANFALIFAGPFLNALTAISREASHADPWALSLKCLCTFVVCASFVILGLHWYLWNRVMRPEAELDEPLLPTGDEHPSARNISPEVSGNVSPQAKKKKVVFGFVEGLRFLARDTYVLCIAVLVISYNVSINLVEVTWKNQLKHEFIHPADYVTFMGYYSSCVGLLTLLMMMFVGGNMVRRMGWGFTAQFTPWMLLITGVIFFALVILKGMIGGGEGFLIAAVAVGTVQNVLSKSSKYSLFDPTKEMSYIPLDSDRKTKGKAAIDGVGSRLGKAGGSMIYQILLVIGGTLDNITPYIAVVLGLVIGGWIWAVSYLEPEFEKMTGNKDFQRRGSILRRFTSTNFA